jgi:glycosyltransferase involved in cell wall biosynthesis
MSPLRIAVLCEYSSLNGGERSLLSVIDQLPRDQVEFIVCAPPSGEFSDELRRRSLRHVPFALRDADGRTRARDLVIDQVRTMVDATQPDLLHANSLSMGRLTGAASSLLRIPCTSHLRDIVGLSAAALTDLNRNRRLVAVSHATCDFHVAQGLDRTRVEVIHNGIDCAAFAPRPATGSLKVELQLPLQACVIAAIGQIGLRKGLDVLAEAAVINRDLLPHAHYLIIGERHSAKPESVAFEQALIQRFTAAGMSDRLHLLGRRSDVPRLLNEIDLLSHAARQEPFGRVLLEAAASGTPIVATDAGGTREMLHDESAWLVPPGDARRLAAAIQDACDHPEHRRSKASVARQRIVQDFAIEPRAAQLGRVWRSVLECRGPLVHNRISRHERRG